MSFPFVTFPGTAGNYISTDDINLLDADTAHLQQSAGKWHNFFQAKLPAQSTDLTPKFGDSHLEWQSTTNDSSLLDIAGSGATSQPAVTGSTEYAVGAWMASADGRDLALQIGSWDIGGSFISRLTVASASPAAGVWERLEGSVTLPANAAFAGPVLRGDASAADELFYADAIVFALGSDASFVPSLHIVGDDFSEVEVALADWTPASSEVLWDDGATKCTVDSAGDFTFEMWGDVTLALSPLVALVDGDKYRVTLSGVESTGVVTFSIDGVTQDTETLTPGSPTFADLNVGASTTPDLEAAGDFYSYTRRDGNSTGPIVARFDAADAAKATL